MCKLNGSGRGLLKTATLTRFEPNLGLSTNINPESGLLLAAPKNPLPNKTHTNKTEKKNIYKYLLKYHKTSYTTYMT